MSATSTQSSINKKYDILETNDNVSPSGKTKHCTRDRLLCLECRRRKKHVNLFLSKINSQCHYDSVDDDCTYCSKTRKHCGKKLTKSEYLNKNGRLDPHIHSIQASLFIEFWIKSMKLQYPATSEEELLDVFKKSIEQKEEQLKLKRGRSIMDEDDGSTAGETTRDGSIDTIPADIAPSVKKRLLRFSSHTQPESLTTSESTVVLESDHFLDEAIEKWWIFEQ